MRRLICLLLACGLLVDAHAQYESAEKFRAEAQTNPGYQKFRQELSVLVKNAKGKNSNAAAVKALFLKNATLLSNIRKKAGLPAVKTLGGKIVKTKPIYFSNTNSLVLQKKIAETDKKFTINSYFNFAWTRSDFGYDMPSSFLYDTTTSSPHAGTVYAAAWGCEETKNCLLGLFTRGIGHYVRIPLSSKAMYAFIKIQFSFEYSAWDTYGSKTGIDLITRISPNFVSAQYNGLPDAAQSEVEPTGWKKWATLMPSDSVTTEMKEYNVNIVDYFGAIEGYVTPGSTIDIRIGFGFPAGTTQGVNGSFHRVKFTLSRLTVDCYTDLN